MKSDSFDPLSNKLTIRTFWNQTIEGKGTFGPNYQLRTFLFLSHSLRAFWSFSMDYKNMVLTIQFCMLKILWKNYSCTMVIFRVQQICCDASRKSYPPTFITKTFLHLHYSQFLTMPSPNPWAPIMVWKGPTIELEKWQLLISYLSTITLISLYCILCVQVSLGFTYLTFPQTCKLLSFKYIILTDFKCVMVVLVQIC